MTENAREFYARKRRDADWFGQPKGLSFLFATEMWERFSYYGMRALLVLYMVDYLLKPERAATVLGLRQLRQGLEAISGPLGEQSLVAQIYGLYTGFVYLTPILGGLIADRWLGRRRTVAIGAALMVAGHFLMASEPLFLLALLTLVLGNGAFKPNIVTQVSGLYAPDDPRRDRAYSIFYVGTNVGAFLSPLICGTLGEVFEWRYGFASAGVGMAIGLVTYLTGLPLLPRDPTPPRDEARGRSSTADPGLRRALFGLLLLFLPSALFWAAYEQQGLTIVLWAAGSTDRAVDFGIWRGEIPVTWFQAFNPLLICLLTPPLVAWWAERGRRGREPATITKLSLGCFGLALGYLVMAAAAWMTDDAKASWLWLAVYFLTITVAELYFSPSALSLVSRLAPERSRSLLLGVWLTTNFTGNLFAGWLGSLWSSLPHVAFFLLVTAIAAAAGAVIKATSRPLIALLQD